MSVGVNPPKTPVTQGSSDVAAATLPNVCKMPGPPAPFVPTPLPNIGKSGDRLKKCTTKVLVEGKKVAIEGSYYMSMGDIASKGTGGGLFNGSTHGKTEFAAPGSMNVKAQGKNIQLVGDAMTNNGNTTNKGATAANVQITAKPAFVTAVGDAALALAICKAACGAKKAKGKNKKKRFQNEMRKLLDPKVKGVRGAGGGLSAGLSNRILTEVGMKIGAAGTFVGKWGAAGAGAGMVAGGFVKWDIVVVNPAAAVLGGLTTVGAAAVVKIIEVKFTDLSGKIDKLTDQQQLAKSSMTPADRAKLEEMDVEAACTCP